MSKIENVNSDSIEIEIVENLRKAQQQGMIPVFVLVRESTKDQKEKGHSPEIQTKEAIAYADNNKFYIVHLFSVAESAWENQIRKIFHQMIELSKKYHVHNLMFMNTDRMTRGLDHWLLVKKLIFENNYTIHLWQLHKSINKLSSPDDLFLIELQVLLAARESSTTSSRVKRDVNYRIEHGIAPGPSPLGYKYIKKDPYDETKKRGHVRDADKADLILHIFDIYDNKKLNLRQLRDKLNDDGIKSPKGYKWSAPFLRELLINPFYAGYFHYKRNREKLYKGIHEPYITLESWEERVKRMSDKNRSKRRPSGQEFPFSGLLRCGKCKRMLTGEMKKGKFMYWLHLHDGLDRTRLRQNDIISKIDDAISEISLNPNFEEKLMQSFEKAATTIDNTQEKGKQKTKPEWARSRQKRRGF